MAGATFVYDESGTTFYYFLLSFELLCVIPCTYYFYPRSPSRNEELKDKTICHCYGCCVKNTRLSSKEPLKKAKERFIKFLLFVGWVIFFLTVYKVTNLQHDYVAYDPFQILEIEPESSMAEIKKAYRRLSLVYHPDKETGDETMFMRIAKAYAALTDDESRKNWELYGNPDGPGPTTFGIALPSYIVDKENTVLVLGLYALIFMVALPVCVTIWWYRSVRYSGDEILIETCYLYYNFIYKSPHMIFKRVLMVIAASMEFEKGHNSEIVERESDNYEVPQLIREIGNLGEKNKERPLCYSYSVKARCLIHAHLSRLKLSKNLESDKLVIIRKCPALLSEFVSCTAQLTMLALAGQISRMPNLTTMENAMKLSSCIVQALWDNKSPLLQLPHLNEDILKHFTSRKRSIRSIFQLACMPDDERRGLLRTLSDDEYQDVMNVISNLPVIELEVRSVVLDDDGDSFNITAGAMVTVTVNLIRRNLSEVMKESNERDIDTAVCADEENSEQANIANGDISPKRNRKDVWKKTSNKKKRGKKTKRKIPAAAPGVKSSASVKKGLNSSESLPNGISENDKGDDSDSDDSSLSAAAKGEDENNEHSKEKNDNSKDKNEMDDSGDEDWEKFQKKFCKKKDKERASKSKESHVVHAPMFPDEKHEAWWVYLTNKHTHSLVTNPYFVTNLVFKEEVEMKFSAPNKPGVYTYSVIVRSDSYIDFDVIKTIQLDVKEAKEVDITKVQWDVSEEEEEKDEEESAVEDSDLASDEVDDD